MIKIQDDEEVIKKLYFHLTNEFPRLEFKIKIPLKELFPEPKNQWLKSFWNNNSHADIAIFRHGKLTSIIEPGGFFHISDPKQKVRDKKKDLICKENGINCLRLINTIVNDLDNPKFRKLLKKYFYGMVRFDRVRRGSVQ